MWCHAEGCGLLTPTGRQTPNSLAERHLTEHGGYPHHTIVWSVPTGNDPQFPTQPARW